MTTERTSMIRHKDGHVQPISNLGRFSGPSLLDYYWQDVKNLLEEDLWYREEDFGPTCFLLPVELLT